MLKSCNIFLLLNCNRLVVCLEINFLLKMYIPFQASIGEEMLLKNDVSPHPFPKNTIYFSSGLLSWISNYKQIKNKAFKQIISHPRKINTYCLLIALIHSFALDHSDRNKSRDFFLLRQLAFFYYSHQLRRSRVCTSWLAEQIFSSDLKLK